MIDDYSFHSCSSLVKINISLQLIRIGKYSFYEYSSLEEVNVLNNENSMLQTIDDYAFYWCDKLIISLSPNLNYIGKRSLSGKSQLIEIPMKTEIIMPKAFYGIIGLKTIVVLSKNIIIDEFGLFCDVNLILFQSDSVIIKGLGIFGNITKIQIESKDLILQIGSIGSVSNAFELEINTDSATIGSNAIGSTQYAHSMKIKSRKIELSQFSIASSGNYVDLVSLETENLTLPQLFEGDIIILY